MKPFNTSDQLVLPGLEGLTGEVEKPFRVLLLPDWVPDRVNLEVPFSATNPIPTREYGGVIEIAYCPGEAVIEYESFALWIETFSSAKLTHEGVAVRVMRELANLVEPVTARVTVRVDYYFQVKASVTLLHPSEIAWALPNRRTG